MGLVWIASATQRRTRRWVLRAASEPSSPPEALLVRRPRTPRATLFPYTTLFRSREDVGREPPQVHRGVFPPGQLALLSRRRDRKSTRLNSSHSQISYDVFCLKKKNQNEQDAATVREEQAQRAHICSGDYIAADGE